MAKNGVSLRSVEEFLQLKRIALAGVSRNRQGIGAMLLREFTRRGCEVSLVNPNVSELFGQRCYSMVQQIVPPPEGVLLLTSPSVTPIVVRDCADAGIRRVWMYRGGFGGAVNEDAVAFCREKGIEVIAGECPFMFLKPVRHVHWLHRLLYKVEGKYPAQA